MKNVTQPSKKVAFNCKDEVLVNLVIKLLRDTDLKVYEDTTEFDPTYPYVVWDGDHLTQYIYLEGDEDLVIETDMGKFLKHFFIEEKIVITLTEDYNAVVYAHEVKVGCQTIPAEKIEEVYKAMKNLSK